MITRRLAWLCILLGACRAPDARPTPTPATARAHHDVSAPPDAGQSAPRWLEIAPGMSDYCALRDDGDVICEDPCSRRQQHQLSGARHLAYTGGVACAIVSSSSVECWMPLTTEPERIAGVTGAQSLSVGRAEACAILSDGTARCWTIATEPESDSVVGFPTRPTDPGITDVVHLDLGIDRACFVRRSGEVLCRTRSDPVPIRVPGIDDALRVSVGAKLGCAVKKTGKIACWDSALVATPALGAARAVDVGLGLSHACALDARGRVKCWGVLSAAPGALPALMPLLKPATSLSAGWMTSCVLREDGTARCWGGFCDQCGDAVGICVAGER